MRACWGLAAGVASALLCRRAAHDERRARLARLVGSSRPAPPTHPVGGWLDRLGRARLVAPLGSNLGLQRRARLAGVRWRPDASRAPRPS